MLRKLLGLNKVDGDYGVEVELNGAGFAIPEKNWRTEHDGSLGNDGIEYVMRKPQHLKESIKEVEGLYKSLTDAGTRIIDRSRAGVHVHINIQEWDVKQMMTFATTYYLLEEILVRWCGDTRSGNHFCLRAKDAENVIFTLYQACINRDIEGLANEDIRYASLNFNSVFKYGSLELRCMRSPTTAGPIVQWLKIVDELKRSSLKFNSPLEVVEAMSGEGDYEFMHRLLPTTGKLLNEVQDGIPRSITTAARQIQMIAFGIDWNKEGGESVNPFKQAKNLWC